MREQKQSETKQTKRENHERHRLYTETYTEMLPFCILCCSEIT